MTFLRWLLVILLFLMLLAVPHSGKHNGPSFQVAAIQYERAPLEGRDYVLYTVQVGDTMESLERRFRVPSMEAILKLNRDLDPDHLPIDEQIKIPLQ